MLSKKEVASLRNSDPISRERLEEIAYWIEQDISELSNGAAFDFLFGECELMYSELIKVIAGKYSSVYPELNGYNQNNLQRCKWAIVLLNIELEISYPIERDVS